MKYCRRCGKQFNGDADRTMCAKCSAFVKKCERKVLKRLVVMIVSIVLIILVSPLFWAITIASFVTLGWEHNKALQKAGFNVIIDN